MLMKPGEIFLLYVFVSILGVDLAKYRWLRVPKQLNLSRIAFFGNHDSQ